MSKEDLDIYFEYKKALGAVGDLNPLYVLTFDSWMKEALPELELNYLQRARILILTNELTKKFTTD